MTGLTGDLLRADGFWTLADRFVTAHRIVIDRPRGSAHPRFPQILYPLDYGYLDGTSAMDGDGIDLWRGGQDTGLDTGRVTGVIVSLDGMKRDGEVKLLVDCTEVETDLIHAFHNQADWMGGLLVPRPAGT